MATSPPNPRVAHPGIVAIDCTAKFLESVKVLAPGELVKDEHFTLFDSVGALEIMDPKMDSGCLAEGESLEEEYDVTRDILPEEVLGIIDQLLCLEMAWHLGYPLSQTILTSVYVEALMKNPTININEIQFTEDPAGRDRQPKLLFVLRAYCIGMLRGCHMVNEVVKGALYYEEEDFVTNTYDRTLLCDVPLEDVYSVLREARSTLRSLGSSFVPQDISTALDNRLELRIAFLRALELYGLLVANPETLKMPWLQLQGLMELIKEHHELGKPIPEAFSAKLQRQLASTMPPRPIVQLSFEEAYGHFKRLFKDGTDALNVLRYSDTQSLLSFVMTFQTRKPQPLVCVRTLLQGLVFKETEIKDQQGTELIVLRSFSVRQIIDHDLSIVVLPCAAQIDPANDEIEVPSDPRHQTAAQMKDFRRRIRETYLDVFRVFCQNRCRVRRMLCHNVQEWDLLQQDIEEIDSLLQVNLSEVPHESTLGETSYSLPLSSWVYLYKLREMEWIVQLGFELTVYQPDELAGMYWYLNYLAKTRAQHADRIKGFTLRSLTAFQKSEGFKEKDPLCMAKTEEYLRSLSFIRMVMIDAASTWEFADGLCCLYTALQRLKVLPAPSRPYGTDELRYELRMKPFATTPLPQLPTFDEFTRATAQPETSMADLISYAEGAIIGAKRGYDGLTKMTQEQAFSVGCHDWWLAGINDCRRAAISAGIAIAQLKKAFEAGGEGVVKLKIELPAEGKRFSESWIVPRLSAAT